MSEPFIRARDQDIVGFNCFWVRRGIHWRSFSGPMSPEVVGRIFTRSTNRQALNAVLTKAWPYDGKYRAAYAYGDSRSGTRFRLVAGCRKCTPALASALLPLYVSVGKRFGTGGKTGLVPLPNYPGTNAVVLAQISRALERLLFHCLIVLTRHRDLT